MPASQVSSRAFEMKQVRAAAAELRRQHLAPPLLQLVERMLSTCESLERDLAGEEMRVAAIEAAGTRRVSERDYLFEAMPAPCVEIDGGGLILNANPAAATLLNTGRKHLPGRMLLHFADDRQRFESFIQKLSLSPHLGGPPPLSCSIRPREQAPIQVDCSAVARDAQESSSVLIFLIPKQAPLIRKAPRAASPMRDADTRPSA